MKSGSVIILLIVVAVGAYLLGGTNILSPKPSEADCGRVANYLLIKSNSYSYMRILSIKKIDAIDGQDPLNGQKLYRVDAEVSIKILKECEWYPRWGFDVLQPKYNFSRSSLREVGYRDTFVWHFTFYKTENGWQGSDGNIY